MKKLSGLVILTLTFFAASNSTRAENFTAYLTGAQEVPAASSSGAGRALITVNEGTGTLTFTVVFSGLTSAQTLSHIHAPAAIGANAPVIINFGTVGGTSGTITGSAPITPTQISQLRQGLGYVNVHSVNFPNGELRGQLAKPRPVDYDGDGRNDFSIWRYPDAPFPGNAQVTYYNLNSTTGVQSAVFGDANTDYPTPGDYDGDGKGDLALMRSGTASGASNFFYFVLSSTNTFQAVQWGLQGDRPVARDYDGDGRTDIAVFRRGATVGSPAYWYILQSLTNSFRAVQWGTTGEELTGGDEPIPADYDGDGKYDVAVYRRGNLSPTNTFIVLRSSDNTATYTTFGNYLSDWILPGDYDGDGKADYAIARTGSNPTNPMVWHYLKSSTGGLGRADFGVSSDIPVQGDYDGDGRTDVAVYRAGLTSTSSSTFYVARSLSNSAMGQSWGVGRDFAVNRFDAR